jgi:hypothetical protein
VTPQYAVDFVRVRDVEVHFDTLLFCNKTVLLSPLFSLDLSLLPKLTRATPPRFTGLLDQCHTQNSISM